MGQTTSTPASSILGMSSVGSPSESTAKYFVPLRAEEFDHAFEVGKNELAMEFRAEQRAGFHGKVFVEHEILDLDLFEDRPAGLDNGSA